VAILVVRPSGPWSVLVHSPNEADPRTRLIATFV
jgi:hypothetical protein